MLLMTIRHRWNSITRKNALTLTVTIESTNAFILCGGGLLAAIAIIIFGDSVSTFVIVAGMRVVDDDYEPTITEDLKTEKLK